MKAYLTRDSVAAGDDADAPHAREIDVPDDVTVTELVQLVWRDARLPSISGGQATWALSSIVPLAVGAQQWGAPRILSSFPPKLAELDVKGGTVRLHFSYFAQRDPEAVFEVLRRLRLRAEG
jgi:hypothetical protein